MTRFERLGDGFMRFAGPGAAMLIMFGLGIGFGIEALKREAVQRGYATHCPDTGEWAWQGEYEGIARIAAPTREVAEQRFLELAGALLDAGAAAYIRPETEAEHDKRANRD
jgi:hypothetical protein